MFDWFEKNWFSVFLLYQCQLILAGGTATDDPESDKVLSEVKEGAGNNPDIRILLLPPDSDLEINALQTAATVYKKELIYI
ncbi:hypothetical protein JCM13991_21330 [Thermodesulfovibrio hydrogeniphilus]